MRLKSLKIKNFRAINGEENIIQFGDNNIVFIFGKNNIGKSSILHAYQYFASPTQSASATDFYNHNTKTPIIIEAIYTKELIDDKNFDDKGLNKWVDAHGDVKLRKTWATENGTAKKETFDPTKGEFADGGFGGLDQILTNATPNIIYIEAMPSAKSLTDWLEKEIKSKLLKKLKENHTDEYEKALKSVRDLQEKVEGEDYLGKIREGANKYFAKTFPELELKIQSTPNKEADLSKAFEKDFSITIGKKGEIQTVEAEERLAEAVETLEALSQTDDSQRSVDRQFDLHGHGLIRQAIINILGIFKETKENQKHIILFEEPELYLHPSNKRKFRDTLYDIADQPNYQMICVSHDPQLIDLSRPHTSLARFVRMSNGETAIYQAGDNVFCKDAETKDRVQMLNRFNPHICETFFADEVILVEGDTEAIVLRELLAIHYKDSEVFVLNTGSKNNIPFFIQTLSHFKIGQHVIHDSDERHLYAKGAAQLNKDGEKTKNSAWTLNQSIWNEIQASIAKRCFAIRYVCIRNFENAHSYKHDKQKGKPLSAHEFAKGIDIADNAIPIVKFLNQIVGTLPRDVEFTPDYLEKTVSEPY
ncbi:putative ATP-dependent endonuclease of OLD family [Variovorax boronicumulans]|uniref:ATP-dependent endonuclease of OLD family n=1 Tax=Variovorax boronicumulans TaxID=436515 RepID=A0AAW8CW46_9BURK|nr:AAA family ATPase [Variovorax boronicumulans]MDP9891927.1 putative ATP-dependent endonuclease of OLD family [Variovorax boronicumulans]MDQ0053100.1 putative ATP-dependent endonuclease of OLD family [Variovorax boronicumulans]